MAPLKLPGNGFALLFLMFLAVSLYQRNTFFAGLRTSPQDMGPYLWTPPSQKLGGATRRDYHRNGVDFENTDDKAGPEALTGNRMVNTVDFLLNLILKKII